MKAIAILFTILTISLAFNLSAFAGDTYSGQAVAESARASQHASMGGAAAIIASGQVVSATAAVPFAVAGSVGAASNTIANDLLDAATAQPGTPLPITDETITAGPPPGEALLMKTNSNKTR